MKRQGTYTTRPRFDQRVVASIRRRYRWFRALPLKNKLLVIGMPILLFLILTPVLTYVWFARDIANADRLMNHNNTGIVLYDRNGQEFYSFGTATRGERTPLDKIAEAAKQALISSEDKDFYRHQGFSATSILAALYANVTSGDATAYGGSTITQQLAKNTLLSDNQTFLRKYQELSIAIAIEQNYSKDEILELYLNSVYFGEGAFGIESAAKTYFNKSAADLSLAESAMLIGLLPAPTYYSPISGDQDLAKQRQETVLSRMVDNNVISEDEKTAALSSQLSYAEVKTVVNDKAQHFAEMVIAELGKRYGEEKVTRSGYKVHTSIDLNAQSAAESAVANQRAYIERNGGSNAAVVAIDPTSGEVLALIGSVDYNNDQFGNVNMAATPRQPGSSFKPIYFSRALADGVVTPATIIKDEATTFDGNYKPENYDFRFRGNISVRNALAQSLNIPAVKTLQSLGTDKAVDEAKALGISTLKNPDDYGLSLALGAAETRLDEMTNAYATFANGGNHHDITVIRSIDDKYGKTIFTAKNTSKRALSEGGAFLITDILSDNTARAPSFGSTLNISGYDVAVKTGTTDDSRDAWTIGYTPQVAVGVWVGNNDNTVMKLGGSSMSGPIWKNTLTAIMKDKQPTEFNVPSSVTQLLICSSNGQKATSNGSGVIREYFLRTKTPAGTCSVPSQRTPQNQTEQNQNQQPQTPSTPAPTQNNQAPSDQDDGTTDDTENETTEGQNGGGATTSPGGTTTPTPVPTTPTPTTQ